ncbi:HAMP domain-containing sensor histidine kinase [Desulfobacterales bacterium HSG17]|nr:HAMP domain-containing sensor histidine kinase [Desulfobacterales bacterium HSG17]
MKRLKKFKPAFWDHHNVAGSPAHTGFNFQRKWKLIVVVTSLMAILPLFVMGFMDFSLSRKTIEDEIKHSISKILISAVISISFAENVEKYAFQYSDQCNCTDDEDMFVVDQNGTLLTPSLYYGELDIANTYHSNILKNSTGVKEDMTPNGTPVIAGYARIPNSSLTLILVKSKKNIADLWLKPRLKLIGYLAVSMVLIVLSIMGMATFLVGRIHRADRKRVKALHHIGYTDKLASIGRLASGIAHEVNNPLAIIDQKTGLIQDIFTLTKEFKANEQLNQLTKDILKAVERCGTVTRRLLDFSRHMDSEIEVVDIEKIIRQIFSFLKKDAERQGITMSFNSRDNIENFECDRGNLQQIFLNLFNNAFAAMDDGGELKVDVKLNKDKKVIIAINDTGIGISTSDINQIFEPFFSSKDAHWGTGLGLSITYGLIKEMNGNIVAKSKIGKGTSFIVILPLKAEIQQDPDQDAV